MANKKLFGTDGVRGIANQELTAELALKLGMAAGKTLTKEGQTVRVLIGQDTRRSGTMLGSALAAGFCSMGAQTALIGTAPTPAVAYLVKHGDYDLGAVISASHNPAPDNGIKFFGSDGKKLPSALEAQMEKVLEQIEQLEKPVGAQVGWVEQPENPLEPYYQFLRSMIEKPLAGLKIVVDGANGAAYAIAPRLLSDVGAEVISIATEPDGININQDCGSTHPKRMMEAVKASGAALGVAFDGDADRAILCDENGVRVDGDRVIALWSLHEQAKGRLTPSIAVGTVMSNLGFEKLLNSEGIELVRTPVGDRYVSEAMREKNALIGGEQSGHIIFSHRSDTGDGLVTLLETLRVMQESETPLSELAHRFTPYPQRLVNLRVQKKDGWDINPAIVEAIRNAENLLSGRGRINVRPSGTEPLLRVMVEAETQALMEEALNPVVAVMEREIGGHVHSITELSEV